MSTVADILVSSKCVSNDDDAVTRKYLHSRLLRKSEKRTRLVQKDPINFEIVTVGVNQVNYVFYV